jgi:hypothetical protein
MKVFVVCGVVMVAFFLYVFVSMAHEYERMNDAVGQMAARYAR